MPNGNSLRRSAPAATGIRTCEGNWGRRWETAGDPRFCPGPRYPRACQAATPEATKKSCQAVIAGKLGPWASTKAGTITSGM